MSNHDVRQMQLDAVKTVEDILEALSDEHVVRRVAVSFFDGEHSIVLNVPDPAQADGVARFLLGEEYRSIDGGHSVHRFGELKSVHGVFPIGIHSERPKAEKIAELEAELATLRGDVA